MKKQKRIKPRNPYVVPSKQRKAGTHVDRRRTLRERALRQEDQE